MSVETICGRQPIKLETPPARVVGGPDEQIRVSSISGIDCRQNVEARVAIELRGVNVRRQVLIEGLPQYLLVKLHRVVADPDRRSPPLGKLGHLLRELEQGGQTWICQLTRCYPGDNQRLW